MNARRTHMGWGPDESLTPESLEELLEGPGLAAEEDLHVFSLLGELGDEEAPGAGDPLVDNGLEMLMPGECYELLNAASLGRVGVSVAGVAVILPVAYAMVGDDVVFLTSVGMKFDAARAGRTMTFEIDGFDPERRSGWSVLVVGLAGEIDRADLYGPAAERLRPAAPGQRHHVVRIRTDMVSGRRFRRSTRRR